MSDLHQQYEAVEQYNNDGSDDSIFSEYEVTAGDSSPQLLLSRATVFCIGITVIAVVSRCILALKFRNATKQQEQKEFETAQQQSVGTKEKIMRGLHTIALSSYKETTKMLKLATPYTISALANTTISNICLMFVSKEIGAKAVAAYALVQILVGIVDGMLQGPIFACTKLSVQAVRGSGRDAFLAGQFIQLAVLSYLMLNVPVVCFWWHYMHKVILFLEWGDDTTATLAQDFVRVYIWSHILGGVSKPLWQLLEITDHAVEGRLLSRLWGVTNAFAIGTVVTASSNVTLQPVALAYLGTAIFYVSVTFGVAKNREWLKPFENGLFWSFSFKNRGAVKQMLKYALPLSLGSLFSSAEWATLTLFASHLGFVEVAAWAILGSIWEVFYSTTGILGCSSEIRVFYHLGDNRPTKAKFSVFKSLPLGMVLIYILSTIYFSLQEHIPEWFTSDETLQDMLSQLVPFVGVASLSMTFGMQRWSLTGAHGKYKLVTWMSLFSSWGICMPLSALYVFALRVDLQGLVAGILIGYAVSAFSQTNIKEVQIPPKTIIVHVEAPLERDGQKEKTVLEENFELKAMCERLEREKADIAETAEKDKVKAAEQLQLVADMATSHLTGRLGLEARLQECEKARHKLALDQEFMSGRMEVVDIQAVAEIHALKAQAQHLRMLLAQARNDQTKAEEENIMLELQQVMSDSECSVATSQLGTDSDYDDSSRCGSSVSGISSNGFSYDSRMRSRHNRESERG